MHPNRRYTEWRPRCAAGQFGRFEGATIGELSRHCAHGIH